MRLLKMLLPVLLVCAAVRPAFAGPFEDGLAAYDRDDYATALRLWRPLADAGDATAQYNLGIMYRNGRGVPKDYVQAHMWFNLAASNAHDKAVEDRDRVAARMTPVQIAEAQRLSLVWRPKPEP